MKLTRYALIAATALMSASAAFAEDDAPKFSIKPTGRILMDGAVYMGGNSGIGNSGDSKFVDGVAIPDLRLGAKASYGRWRAKIDVGFAYGKVGLKDTYFEYDFNDANFLRGGYFVPQWGLNSETSSSMKPSYEEPSSNEFFNANPRVLALMWEYNKGQFLAGTSVFAEANVMTQKANVMGKQGWGAQTRLVWRPRHVDRDVAQVGLSLNYTSPNNADHNGFVCSSNFPTRVSQIIYLEANVTHANGAFKLSQEILFIKNRFAFESQYYFYNIFRHRGYENYQAHGAYGMIRTQLIGSGYCNNSACRALQTRHACICGSRRDGSLYAFFFNHLEATMKYRLWQSLYLSAGLDFYWRHTNYEVLKIRDEGAAVSYPHISSKQIGMHLMLSYT